ncbi:hypothetical protein GJ496_000026 [Pomphorhynchus laevis]|nr:hypothetical protein GJ496_000026 [Pomphorhynchus laevis]
MASILLIKVVRSHCPTVTQRWDADDSDFIGMTEELSKVCWIMLKKLSQSFGERKNSLPARLKQFVCEIETICLRDTL